MVSFVIKTARERLNRGSIWLNNQSPPNDNVKPAFVAVGASILILGGAIISIGPFLTTSAFYRTETSLIRQGPNGPNPNSTYSVLSDAVNQATTVVILGVILAPIGGGILAYGLTTSNRQEAVARLDSGRASRNEAEPPDPAKAS